MNVAQLIERLQQGVESGEWSEETEVYCSDGICDTIEPEPHTKICRSGWTNQARMVVQL